VVIEGERGKRRLNVTATVGSTPGLANIDSAVSYDIITLPVHIISTKFEHWFDFG